MTVGDVATAAENSQPPADLEVGGDADVKKGSDEELSTAPGSGLSFYSNSEPTALETVPELPWLHSARSSRLARCAAASPSALGAQGKRCAGLTPNIRTLMLTSFLFLSLALAQVIAAKISMSRALMVDSISMIVDGMTYFCNIFVECRRLDGGDHLRSQLLVTGASLTCLAFFTVQALVESWGVARVCLGLASGAHGDDEELDEVNPQIVLVFALAGLLFDVASLVSFWRSARKSEGGAGLNMRTALLHVGADFLRSTTTLVMSLLIIVGHFDGGCSDAVASVLVCGTILAGAAQGFASWFSKLFKLLRASE